MQWWMDKYKLKLFCPERFFCWFWAYGFYTFQKVHKICNRLIYNMAKFGQSHFSPYRKPLGVILPCGGFSLDFKYMVLIFDWYIILLYLGTLIFDPTRSPRGGGGLFCARGPMYNCLLYFSDCIGVRNIWPKFHAFITFCKVVVLMALTIKILAYK